MSLSHYQPYNRPIAGEIEAAAETNSMMLRDMRPEELLSSRDKRILSSRLWPVSRSYLGTKHRFDVVELDVSLQNIRRQSLEVSSSGIGSMDCSKDAVVRHRRTNSIF